jgi:membrane protease YdiL (CAAX protease family)
MEKSNRIKTVAFAVVKVISLIVAIILLQRIALLPISHLSKTYWSHLDGRGLNEPWFLSSSIAISLASLSVVLLFLKYLDKKKWTYIRLTFDKYVRYFSLGVAVSFVLVILFTLFNVAVENTQLILNYSSLFNVLFYFIILFIGILSLVVYEEVVYRGYILKTFEAHFGIITSIILSSLFFSAAHLLRENASLLSFVNIFLAGVFLSIICINYNSLWASIGFHFGWNYFLWLVNYPVSGARYTNPILILKYNEYNLFSGSEFGPEDSIILTILLTLLISYFLYKHKRKTKEVLV